MATPLNKICSIHDLDYTSSYAVSGGDINTCYAVETNKGTYFIKLNSSSLFPLMFQKEADGLKALQGSTSLKAPATIACGEYAQQQYLIMEWMEKATPLQGFWNTFAEGLAQLHRNTDTNFGWPTFNYIGSLVQQNNTSTDWSEFYSTQRILPLAEKLFNAASFSKADVQAAENVCSRLKEIFPEEPPSLLHGDLWAGNFMAVKSTINNPGTPQVVPCIYDPAVYFGHREMDIGMTLLFGGFNSSFYDSYNEHFPLESSWRQRVSLTQLYPLLVHAILFGGGYVSQCRNILTQWK